MTTEERLYKLEGIVEGVMATLPGQVTSLEGRVDLLRQEVKAEIGALRREVEEKFNGLRQEQGGNPEPSAGGEGGDQHRLQQAHALLHRPGGGPGRPHLSPLSPRAARGWPSRHEAA
mgnify:CR=1 FL=1